MDAALGLVVIGGVVVVLVSRLILDGFAARRSREVEVFIMQCLRK